MFFTTLVAEALGMPASAFDRFFDPHQQHKLKIVKYPEVDTADADADADAVLARQGVGPHKDSMLSSFLLQVTPHRGLQAQNVAGRWIDALPCPGTLVVAFGQGLEALTGGVCASTTHRVLSPRRGEGPRFSVPFFQGVSYDARFEEMRVPDEVRALLLRGEGVGGVNRKEGDDVEFTFRAGRWGQLGEATLVNRVKSHPDVGERWVSVAERLENWIGMLADLVWRFPVSRASGQGPRGAGRAASDDGQDDLVRSKGRRGGDDRLNALMIRCECCICMVSLNDSYEHIKQATKHGRSVGS
jgi:hypothetical protein